MHKFLKIFCAVFIFMFLMTPITFGADTITVTAEWGQSTSSDVAGYNIYRSEVSGSGYVKLNETLINDTTFVDVILEGVEKTFYYTVTAVDQSDNESGYSNEAFTRVDNIAPDVVPDLVIKSVTVGIQ